jgi:uncharacterized protein (DUF488 family)
MSPVTIHTVGHSTRPLDEFISLLQAHGIRHVADVRSTPTSRRYPHFAREALAASLPAAGIGYHWMPALGGRRRPRPDSPNDGWRNLAFRGYADHMQSTEFREAVDDLVELARGNDLSIMCAEAVPWRCHRRLIGDALLARGLRVRDIMTPTSAPEHELTPFARVDGTTVTYPAEPLIPVVPST